MAQPSNIAPFTNLLDQFRSGQIDRRRFMTSAGLLGISASAAGVLANGATGLAQGTPAGTPATALERPALGTEEQTRGQGDQLRIIWWQAPSLLSPHQNGDSSASSLVIEPLLTYFPGEQLGAVLLDEVPSVENGLLAEDLSTVTLRLKEGLVWSDGEPVTANDIVFTWQWVTNPDNASTSFELWNTLASVEAIDDLSALMTYKTPVVNWFEPFVGSLAGIIYPAHVFGNDPANRNDQFGLAPIGTGPWKVDTFTPNDQVTFSINESFREPNKPYFATVLFKGGGDAVSAGRSVVQTNDFDFAWNVQAEPEIINELRENGDAGQIIQTEGTTLESIYINFSDPNQEVDGQRSEKDTPHPILSDLAVRQALNLAIQRDLIASEFYGDGELATANQFTGLDYFESPNTSWEYNLESAAQILDEAGWTLDGDVRAKDGVELALTYATSVNQVRQKTQAVVQQDLESLGFRIELEQVDSTIFFDATAGNDQNLNHFYWDIAMWSTGGASSIPVVWAANWYAGENGRNIAQAENGWQQPNVIRYQSAEYDELYEQLLATTSREEAAELIIGLNDTLINDVAMVPIAIRSFYTAINNRLRMENIAFEDTFVEYFWNIWNWNLDESQ
ncbi:MAG: peptide ABC transporter substrate-binding protein [Chloroflexota bacterium]|nr:peptide ABC transporter substrate-binding protein [Chloroflexota bacterium]